MPAAAAGTVTKYIGFWQHMLELGIESLLVRKGDAACFRIEKHQIR